MNSLQQQVGVRFFFKNDGQNPSASFKDRGMASALSYINFMIRKGEVSDVLAICASTGIHPQPPPYIPPIYTRRSNQWYCCPIKK